jgi:hypothetical protein
MAKKNSETDKNTSSEKNAHGAITSKTQLKEFLLNVRDKLADGSSAPIYTATALNYAMNLPEIYDYLTKENKEIARDIWLRLKQAGMQINNPPLLFGSDEDEVANI